MQDIINFISSYDIIQILKDGLWIMGLFGIAIDATPNIKIRPIRWLLSKLGHLLNADLYKRLDELEIKVDKNLYDQEQKRIKDIRSKILDFSNSLAKRERDIEEYEEIFDLDEEYIKLLGKYNMTNGRTTRAMQNIKRHYDIAIALME